MSFDIIATLCEWLAAELDVPVSVRPPGDRPDAFITIERTGGGAEFARDLPDLAVQAWAATDLEAYALAIEIRDLIVRDATGITQVCRAEVGSIYQFPDPESRQARVQLDVSLVTRL